MLDRERIRSARPVGAAALPVTRGQLDYEFDFLRRKVQARDPQWDLWLSAVDPAAVAPHPLFRTVGGPVEGWERVRAP